ncbi:amidase [Methylacidiphilum caldifontis]|uniref:Glutamyl-tRNA amidotransferase n=1 Tax=Methylacidiphilum caldifontis TaxID=2795386 RepID=A0A4Y8PGK7_9BACT|nr:amidase [Methylacidiphilum caldifontis]TFE71075.1 glutamyl-tRNA amidotransferase [Methylacidiphilum caldifontis]
MKELWKKSATELSHLIRNREISPVELVNLYAERIEKIDPYLHAFTYLSVESAKEKAKALEKEILEGSLLSPLCGVPIAIKEHYDIVSLPSTHGSLLFKDYIAKEDHLLIKRLKEAKALILGKTNMPEFGFSAVSHNPLFPATKNPWNFSLTAGGSSSGSAAAVAAGLCPLSLGSDGGGSIRIPASFCGIFGYKPSRGRIPWPIGRGRDFENWELFSHAGPLCRTVEDAVIFLSVLAGPDPSDPYSLPPAEFGWENCLKEDIKGLKIAYSLDLGYARVDPELKQIISKAIELFESDLGCKIEEVDPGWPDPSEAFLTLVYFGADLIAFRKAMLENRKKVSPHISDFVERNLKPEDFSLALKRRREIIYKMSKLMEKYDLFLSPVTAIAPFELYFQGPDFIAGHPVNPHVGWIPFTYIMNMTGQPAAAVPAGWTSKGLPVGLQIAGKHLDDLTTLKASYAFEKVCPWNEKWPSIAFI